MTLPHWLQEHLRTIGADNPDGVSRRARLTHCRTCRRTLVVGLDADPCGIAATADAQEIDAVGEYLALTLGLRTFTLTRTAGTWQLEYRDQFAVAGEKKHPILAAHTCTIRLPPAVESLFPPAPPPTPAYSADPPF
jgi:hypothetical protein